MESVVVIEVLEAVEDGIDGLDFGRQDVNVRRDAAATLLITRPGTPNTC
jgi:hypothetical protein